MAWGALPELKMWQMWHTKGKLPHSGGWREQPLKQLVIIEALDLVYQTWRLKGTKDYNWTQEFSGTQLKLVGWIDGT